MIKLSQLDPAWAAKKLGASDLTCKGYGCTTCCVSMISDDFGCYKSPAEIAKLHSNYTKDGLILWTALDKFFEDKMRFVWRGYGPAGPGKVSVISDFAPIINILNNPNQRIALQVNNGAHWVKLVNNVDGDWLAIDPLGGIDCRVLAKYGNITGYAIFEKIDENPNWPDEHFQWMQKHGIVEKAHEPNAPVTWAELSKVSHLLAKKILEWVSDSLSKS